MSTHVTLRSGPVRIQARGLSKTYVKGGESIQVLRDVDLDIEAGGKVSIVGPSGCGKSTFLHLVGLLDTPSKGQLLLDELDVSRAGGRASIASETFGSGSSFRPTTSSRSILRSATS